MMAIIDDDRKIDDWIGLIHVRPMRGAATLGSAKGAYVNAIARVAGEEEFRKAVTDELAADSLIPVEFDDVDLVENYRKSARINGELEAVIRCLDSDHLVAFDVFDTYLKDDA